MLQTEHAYLEIMETIRPLMEKALYENDKDTKLKLESVVGVVDDLYDELDLESGKDGDLARWNLPISIHGYKMERLQTEDQLVSFLDKGYTLQAEYWEFMKGENHLPIDLNEIHNKFDSALRMMEMCVADNMSLTDKRFGLIFNMYQAALMEMRVILS